VKEIKAGPYMPDDLRNALLRSSWFSDGWALRQVLRTNTPHIRDQDFAWVLPENLYGMSKEPTSLMAMPVIWGPEGTKPHLAIKLKELAIDV
jgi:hypothetical protein